MFTSSLFNSRSVAYKVVDLVNENFAHEEKYDIKTIIPVDMFPWTSHVECCVLLCLKQTMKTA